ncbi:hypothetical protein Xbud_03555 [Xenorhabdus budapestensis]|uniref:Uncharacterized protein n=1 Tax=Xenorhabdus budapestensis TaxID=290110 RepID=A0A2D0INR7_XENBU|nr:hypothetical protein Xbud_03555 [Xenorhabdus budapestensis]
MVPVKIHFNRAILVHEDFIAVGLWLVMKWRSPVRITIDKTEIITQCRAIAAIVSQRLRTATMMTDADNLPADIERGMGMTGNVKNLPRHQFDVVTLPAAGLHLIFFKSEDNAFFTYGYNTCSM